MDKFLQKEKKKEKDYWKYLKYHPAFVYTPHWLSMSF